MASKAKTEFKEAVATIRQILATVFTAGRDDAEKALGTIERIMVELRQKTAGVDEQLQTQASTIAKLREELAGVQAKYETLGVMTQRVILKARRREATCRKTEVAVMERLKVRKGILQLDDHGWSERAIQVHKQRLKEVVEHYVPAISEDLRSNAHRKFITIEAGDFAPCYDADSLFLFGMLIKYITTHNCSLVILTDPRMPSGTLLQEMRKGITFIRAHGVRRDSVVGRIFEQLHKGVDRNKQPKVKAGDRIRYSLADRWYNATVKLVIGSEGLTIEGSDRKLIEGDLIVRSEVYPNLDLPMPLNLVRIELLRDEETS